MRFFAIPGSLRRDAYSTQLARAATGVAPDGIEVAIYDGLDSVPGYNQDLEPDHTPEVVRGLRQQIERADALLIVTPEYNASAPGALKNAIDWASRPHGSSSLQGKPAAIISSSPMPFGGIWANQQIRKAFSVTGTPVTETELAIGKVDEKIGPDGVVGDESTLDQIASLLAELEELVAQTSRAAIEQEATRSGSKSTVA